jgi:hypothetical protein
MTKNEQIWQKSFTNSQSVTDIIEVITQKRNQTTPQCSQLQSQNKVAFEFQIILWGIHHSMLRLDATPQKGPSAFGLI